MEYTAQKAKASLWLDSKEKGLLWLRVCCCMQVYMLLLGVTAMSLLTTPIVIMASIHFLAKDGHGHQVYITGVIVEGKLRAQAHASFGAQIDVCRVGAFAQTDHC
jgi:hypothetical protein